MKSLKTYFYFVLIVLFGYFIKEVLWSAPKQTEVQLIKEKEYQVSHYHKEYDGKKIIASLENLQQTLPQNVDVWVLSAKFYLKEFDRAQNKTQKHIWLNKTFEATLEGLKLNPTHQVLSILLNSTLFWQRTLTDSEKTDKT